MSSRGSWSFCRRGCIAGGRSRRVCMSSRRCVGHSWRGSRRRRVCDRRSVSCCRSRCWSVGRRHFIAVQQAKTIQVAGFDISQPRRDATGETVRSAYTQSLQVGQLLKLHR